MLYMQLGSRVHHAGALKRSDLDGDKTGEPAPASICMADASAMTAAHALSEDREVHTLPSPHTEI